MKFAYGSKLIDFAERTIPGLRDTIVEADVATPVTVMRYLRHPGGAIYGFDQTPSDSALFREQRSRRAGPAPRRSVDGDRRL